jgi:hypothetical protein
MGPQKLRESLKWPLIVAHWVAVAMQPCRCNLHRIKDWRGLCSESRTHTPVEALANPLWVQMSYFSHSWAVVNGKWQMFSLPLGKLETQGNSTPFGATNCGNELSVHTHVNRKALSLMRPIRSKLPGKPGLLTALPGSLSCRTWGNTLSLGTQGRALCLGCRSCLCQPQAPATRWYVCSQWWGCSVRGAALSSWQLESFRPVASSWGCWLHYAPLDTFWVLPAQLANSGYTIVAFWNFSVIFSAFLTIRNMTTVCLSLQTLTGNGQTGIWQPFHSPHQLPASVIADLSDSKSVWCCLPHLLL